MATCKALMLGSGFFPPERKIVGPATEEPEWTTLDLNEECKPDIVFDLESIEMDTEYEHDSLWRVTDFQIPVDDGTFDEIHAYQVLEHFGRQGDFKGFFAGWREFWRILKPGGTFTGDTPALRSPWLWGDPGHTRIVSAQSLHFLTRNAYEGLGKNTSTDYRRFVDPCWWEILLATTQGPLPDGGFGETDRFGFVLKKVQ